MNPYTFDESITDDSNDLLNKNCKEKIRPPCYQLRVDLKDCLLESDCVKEVKDVMYNEFMDYQKTGSNIFELSHRSEPFVKIVDSVKATLKNLMSIPDNYEILLLQGGATGQFSGIPLNLMGLGGAEPASADYLVTGQWSAKAAKEATKYGRVNLVTPLKNVCFEAIFGGGGTGPIPDTNGLTANGTMNGHSASYKDRLRTYLVSKVDIRASYFYYCSNETIDGFEVDDALRGDNFLDTLEAAYRSKWHEEGGGAVADFRMPILVADMSSNFCTKPVDVSRYGLVYAGAQKNIGIAGVTVVVVRRDLVGKSEAPYCPSILSYKVVSGANSLPNTPPVYSIYALNLTLRWTLTCPPLPSESDESVSPLSPWDAFSRLKADMVYGVIDGSRSFYVPLWPQLRANGSDVNGHGDVSGHNDEPLGAPVLLDYRSRINIPFRVHDTKLGSPSEALEKVFTEEAKVHGLLYLKGHRSVGGLRVSLFNSITMEETQRLANFMLGFMDKHTLSAKGQPA